MRWAGADLCETERGIAARGGRCRTHVCQAPRAAAGAASAGERQRCQGQACAVRQCRPTRRRLVGRVLEHLLHPAGHRSRQRLRGISGSPPAPPFSAPSSSLCAGCASETFSFCTRDVGIAFVLPALLPWRMHTHTHKSKQNTHTHTDTHRHTQTHRHTHTQTNTHTHTQPHNHTHNQRLQRIQLIKHESHVRGMYT